MIPSTFEVVGPIMVGPSSSHTAGALRIAQVARDLAPKKIKKVQFVLYNSFSETYKGHGTDKALVAGILGMRTADADVADSFLYAKQARLKFSFKIAGEDTSLHPNTVDILMDLEGGGHIAVRGESRGGGKVRLVGIDGVEIKVRGEHPTLFIHHKDMKGALSAITSILSKAGMNIASLLSFRDERGGNSYTIIESDEKIPKSVVVDVEDLPNVYWATRILIPGEMPSPSNETTLTEFSSAEELLKLCSQEKKDIAQIMRQREIELMGSAREVDEQMEHTLSVMENAITQTIKEPKTSLGGFLHGQAQAVFEALTKQASVFSGKTQKSARAEKDEKAFAPETESLPFCLMGEHLTRATAYAMAVLELSATMGVIVAAPTAGSAGVLPGVLFSVTHEKSQLAKGIYTAAAIGAIIMNNATVAGAEGGCQAEVGSAAGMAAAALCAMAGASPEVCMDAATIALGNLLGLVCDPVRGLVEYPCQNRNAIGVANAYSAAQLALSGVQAPVPLDEAIAAQMSVGHLMPEALRETARGGLALCPSVCENCAQPCA